MALLNISVLGNCSVTLNGKVLPGAPSSFFRLAAFVSISGHKMAASRQRLRAVLWPDVSHPKAAGNLRQALSRSRNFQEKHGFTFLESNFSSIFIANERDVDFDLLTLLDALANPDPDAAVALCSIYSGDLLADLPDSGTEFEDWMAVQRATLHDRITNRLTAAIVPTSELSDAARGICAQKLIELDVCNEEAYCCLMTQAAARGNRSRFETLFETCQRQLMRELGVRPSAHTQRVVAELVKNFDSTASERTPGAQTG